MLTAFFILSHWWLIPSTILMVLIHQYIKKKPPGLQSLLDPMISILLKVSVIHNAFIAASRLLQITYGHMNISAAKVLFFLQINTGVLQLACFQVILVVKCVLIFRPNWLADQMDSEVLKKSALFVLIYTLARFILDFTLVENGFSNELKLLTGTEVEISWRPGPGILIALVIILATLITLKAKTPSLPQDQEVPNLVLNLGLFSAALSILGIIPIVRQIEGRNVILELLVQMTFNATIKVIFPAYFISNTPNLCEYAKHTLQTQVVDPFNEVKAIVLHFIDSLIPTPNQIDVIV